MAHHKADSSGSPQAGNWAVVERLHLETAARLSRSEAEDGVQVEVYRRRDRVTLRVREGEGVWRALHSAAAPEKEARQWAEAADPSGAGLVVVLGFGLGYHLEALAERLEPAVELVVIEPATAVFKTALDQRDLRALLARPRLRLIVGGRSQEALKALGRIQIETAFPRLKALVHQPSLRAMPGRYAELARALERAEKARLDNKLTYPKFRSDRVRTLIIQSRYFLMEELEKTFQNLGHPTRQVLLRDRNLGAEEMIRSLIAQIVDFRPDFILTVNHLGFDRDGVLTDFLSRIRLPFAAWYVDSPLLTVRHYGDNASPWATIFLWDSDYLPEIEALGYDHVHYLPLAADETIFRPLSRAELAGRKRTPIAFVGHSMTGLVAHRLQEAGLSQAYLPLVDQAAEIYASSPGHHVLPAIERSGLADQPAVAGLNRDQMIDLECAVLWRATQVYRLENVKALAGLGAAVVGDEGWRELIDQDDFDIRPRIDYYQELPAFYNLCDVNFNATSLQMKTGLNQRVFDAPACGTFLLTDRRAQMELLFEPGTEIADYASPEEARDKAEFYLTHPRARQKIADAAHRRVMAEHTYRHRLTEMIDTLRRQFTGVTWTVNQA